MRMSSCLLFGILSLGFGKSDGSEPDEWIWTPTIPLRSPRVSPAAAITDDGFIYAIGGTTATPADTVTNTAERFSEATRRWEYIEPMVEKRFESRAVTDSHGGVWVVGGNSGSGVGLDSVERYDPGSHSWTTMASRLNVGRAGHGIAIAGDDSIYVFGGYRQPDAEGVLASTEKYDPAHDTWTLVQSMNEARCQPGFATDSQGRIYAIGGGSLDEKKGVLDTAERYDPVTDTWEFIAFLPVALGNPAAFPLNGEIYVTGGWLGGVGPYSSASFIYSPDTDTWREGPSMYQGVGLAGGVVGASGHPYLIGGQGPDIVAQDRVAVLGPEETNELPSSYQTDFSSNPNWVTDEPSTCHWNRSSDTYFARVENWPFFHHSPNRYFYKPTHWTGESLELLWDVKITRADWSAGISFGLFDDAITTAPGGQSMYVVFTPTGKWLILGLAVWGADGLALEETPGIPYSKGLWYTCQLHYDAETGEVSASVIERDSGDHVWSADLLVPGGFSLPLVKLGGSRSGFCEANGDCEEIDFWAIAECEIDNVVLKPLTKYVGPEEQIFTEDFQGYVSTEDVQGIGEWTIETRLLSEANWQLKATDGSMGDLGNETPDLDGVFGRYMISDSDMAPGVEADESLISPLIDCSRYMYVTIGFSTNIRTYDSENPQFCDLDLSVFNGGAQAWGDWNNVCGRDRYDGDTSLPKTVDLSGYADGQKIKLRWRYHRASFDWWWAIDSVVVKGRRQTAPAPAISRTSDGSHRLTWSPFAFLSYFIEWTDDPSSGLWFLVEDEKSWPTTEVSWVLPLVPDCKKRFYRIGSSAAGTP